MPKISFLVNVDQPEIRVAELHDGQLFDLDVEREGRLLGDIYKGRVENILPGMDAAFVNVGLERNALVYAGDVGPPNVGAVNGTVASIEKLLRVGDEIVVQIARPPQGTKGARVTTRLLLPGRYVVLVDTGDNVGVSRRIPHEDERARLRKLAEKLRPLDHGIIVRTEAENVPEPELADDVKALSDRLHKIKDAARQAPAPAPLYRELGLLGRLARDRLNDEVEEIIIDSPDIFAAFSGLVEAQCPRHLSKLRLYDSSQPLYKAFHIEAEIQRACERVVQLPRGGFLTFDETEALTAIDVNTGKFVGKSRLADTVVVTNLEAVEEAARQIRLRDIAGVIVIDFIDMERARDRIKVMNALETALKLDRTRTRIVQLSPSGLVEITRRREGQSLRQLVHQNCPYCSGDGVIKTPLSVALEVRRRVLDMSRLSEDAIAITLHPSVAFAFVGSDAEYIKVLEAAVHKQLFVRTDYRLHVESSRLEASDHSSLQSAPASSLLGQQLYLSAQAPLYPEAAPHFSVLQGSLVHIPNAAESGLAAEGQPRRSAVLEVTGVNRWYTTARVVVLGEPGEPRKAERPRSSDSQGVAQRQSDSQTQPAV